MPHSRADLLLCDVAANRVLRSQCMGIDKEISTASARRYCERGLYVGAAQHRGSGCFHELHHGTQSSLGTISVNLDRTAVNHTPVALRELVARRLIEATKLPDFLIIGAQKAGTTALADYLAEHPDVVRPKGKEIHFFDIDYMKGVSWYKSHFEVGRRRKLRSLALGKRLVAGDASPYYLFHPLAPVRCFQLLPEARIMIMLRDPVARAYSQYHHEVRIQFESLSFEEALEAEPDRLRGEIEKIHADPSYHSIAHQHFSYLSRGIYLPQISSWLKYYGPDQILILSSEIFLASPAEQYQRVLRFLGLRKCELSAYPHKNVGDYEPMSPKTKARLIEYFTPHNSMLRRYLNSIWAEVGDSVVSRWPSISRLKKAS